ncbi:MAG: hypothetical protein KKF93_06430 [Candidatus Omnitrophica bacterium]|nr:hypothetical protein [Candidatus Omnitrophota bacterium]
MVQVFEDGWINTNQDRVNWIRVDPDTGGLYRYNSENDQYDIPLPISQEAITGLVDVLSEKSDTDHTHIALGDINFTGAISSGGSAGLTGSRLIDGKTLTFTNGLLTGYSA